MKTVFVIVKPEKSIFSTYNKNKYISNITNKMKLLAFQFIDLPQGEIAKIFTNKVWLINLYQLCHISRYNYIYLD